MLSERDIKMFERDIKLFEQVNYVVRIWKRIGPPPNNQIYLLIVAWIRQHKLIY